MAKKSLLERDKKKKILVEKGLMSEVKLNSRCWRCGRPKAVYSDFGICRICLREMGHSGQIPGLRKASW